MSEVFYFPFGEILKKVEQKDKSPKKVFVLGVYASAVHARWLDKDGKEKVKALAVASEPEIFWRGENAGEIISQIHIPPDLGSLTEPVNKDLNGPSGKTLDEKFLHPLGFSRKDTWLCDLLPESRVNPKQRSAINKHYTEEIIEKYKLNHTNIKDFSKKEINSEQRRIEILKELEQSKADILVLLGDEPIYWFLRYFANNFKKLADFGKAPTQYGNPHEININTRNYSVISLCHPRNAGRLGTSSKDWGELHDNWISQHLSK